MENVIEFDNYLLQALNYLRERWYQEHTGIVVSALKDDARIVYATSSRNGKNWVHAERNSYNKFIKLFGKPSANAAFIISLSPCIKNLKYREESSCFELIKNSGISRIHFGVLDTLHAPSLADYASAGLQPSLSKNSNISMMCENLMSLFERYESRINTNLLDIKNELGDPFFHPINLETSHSE